MIIDKSKNPQSLTTVFHILEEKRNKMSNVKQPSRILKNNKRR